MVALLIVLVVLVVLIGTVCYFRQPAVFDEDMRRTLVGLHRVRARGNLTEYKREIRRQAARVRRELDRELDS